MADHLQLNVPFLRRRVPNLTVAARAVGLRPATVSDLCNGKIPLGRAEVRTLVALADLAECSLDELVIRGPGADMIETGIKMVDLFAPLVRGGTAGLVARHGMGQMVILAELIHRLRQRGFSTVLWLPDRVDPHLQDDVAPEAEAVCSSLAETIRHIESLHSGQEILVATDRATVLTGELDALQERMRRAGAPPATFVLVDASGEAPDEQAPYGPLETSWEFDADLMARGLYPAVNPIASTSTLLEGAYLEAAHVTIQQRARKLLRRYRDLYVLARVRGKERIPPAELLLFRRGERLEAFLTQPLYVAERFTGKPGAWVAVRETLEGARLIMEGAADELDPGVLTYQGPFTRER